jgi:hypothetical protein
MRAHHSSAPQIPLDDHVVEATDDRPNRAARRGNRAGPQPAQGHGRAAPHARGAQGRRINPVRRTG